MERCLALVLPLAAVILVSGCTDMSGIPFIGGLFGPPTVKYTNDVVIIRSLDATPATVFPGQSVRLTAYVQNLGKETLKSVRVDLYDYCKGTFEIVGDEAECGFGDGKPVGASACDITLSPYETREVRWTLKAGGSIRLDTTCPADGMKVLVNYWKKTDGLSTISFINYNEMQRQMGEGTFKEKSSSRTAGEGPIKGYINVEDKQPVPVNGDGRDRTVISFQLKNEGSGFLAFKPGESHESKDRPKAYLITGGSTADSMSPAGIGVGSFGKIAPAGDADTECAALRDGTTRENGISFVLQESPKIICSVEINQDVAKKIEKELSSTMGFTIGYWYEFRAAAKVTVKPKALSG